MNKKVSLGFTLSLIAIACAITFILTSFFSLQSFNEKVIDVKEKAKKYEQLENLDNFVRENYYGEIVEEDLNDGILKGYVNGTGDDYSEYLTAEEYQELLAEESGIIIGLGITFLEHKSGYIIVNSIMEGSPGADSILEVGDTVVSVDGVDVLSSDFDEVINMMRGTVGTNVELTIRRDGIDINVSITRQAIELRTVSSEMLDNKVGYIKISSFKSNTPEQFQDQLEYLTMNGAKALIFDLRGNAGGSLSSLENCLDPLLPEGVIATATYNDGRTETIVYSDESELNLPMVVLINDTTASAAELFAASLHDFGKSEIVGMQSYGKGVMQVTHKFDDGSALSLTVAEYQTTVSECYDGVGIVPEYIVEMSDDELDTTDYQLNKAIEVIMNKLLEQ